MCITFQSLQMCLDNNDMDNFINEAKIMFHNLKGSNLLQIICVSMIDIDYIPRACLITKYYKNGNLKSYLTENKVFITNCGVSLDLLCPFDFGFPLNIHLAYQT